MILEGITIILIFIESNKKETETSNVPYAKY